MASAWLLAFATRISAMATFWPTSELEKLECSREWCRNTCLHLGRNSVTQCLVDLWVALTCAKCKLSGLDGADVDEQSIGAPIFDAPMTEINKMNPYQMLDFKASLKVVEGLVEKIEDLEPGLMIKIQALLADIRATVEKYPYL